MYIHVPDKTEYLLKQTTNNPFLNLGFVDGLSIQVEKFLDTHLLVKQAKKSRAQKITEARRANTIL